MSSTLISSSFMLLIAIKSPYSSFVLIVLSFESSFVSSSSLLKSKNSRTASKDKTWTANKIGWNPRRRQKGEFI